MAAHISTATTKFARALRLRCPRCGAHGLRRSWITMVERCPGCGLALERGEEHDYWLGAYAINLVVAEGLTAIVALLLLLLTWPNIVPGMIVGAVLAIVMPLAFFPFSRTVWLAWDMSFRPVEEGDDA